MRNRGCICTGLPQTQRFPMLLKASPSLLRVDVDEEIYWLERSVAAGRAVGSKLKSAQKKREKTMSFGLD